MARMTTTMTRATAACLSAALLAPGFAGAHSEEEARRTGIIHLPEAPRNLQVRGFTGTTGNAVLVTWQAGHSHRNPVRFRQTGYDLRVVESDPSCDDAADYENKPDRCMRRWIPGRAGSVTEIVSGLRTGGGGLVTVTARVGRPEDGIGNIATKTVTFPSSPTIPTCPDVPDAPGGGTPEPEPPGPVTSPCSYAHRLVGVPAATVNAYTSRILVSSEESNAVATIRAYQADDGQRIDVLDDQGNVLAGGRVSLGPARSVQRFRLADVRGWHFVTVEHASARAMRGATVAMQLREPGGGVNIVYADRIDCAPTAAQ